MRMMRVVSVLGTMVMILAASAAFGQQAATPDDTVKKIWKDLYSSKFSEGTPGCEFDYGPQGMKNIYCYVASIFSYERLVALAGVSPFVSGPHSDRVLDLKSQYSFGHYNPDFVRWLADHMIPGASDEEFRWTAQPIYNRYFKGTARVYWLTYQKLSANPAFLETEAEWLKKAMADRTLEPYWHYKYGDFLGEAVYDRFLEGDYYYGNVIVAAVAFWVRRSIDGTLDEFKSGLEKLVRIYDPDFITTAAAIPSAPGKVRDPADRIMFTIGDRVLYRFLDELTAAIESHDWALALTFFSPENFQAQTEMGIPMPQYIEEGFGLNMVDNQLIEKPGDRTEYAKLNAIDAIRLTAIKPLGDLGLIKATGTVTLFDGSQRKVELYMIKTVTGGYILEPPVG